LINSQKRIQNLIESLPYIMEFKGKTFVIKFGGSIMENEVPKKAFIQDIVFMEHLGINIVIVHGGGSSISKRLTRLNIESQFIDGLRVTDKEVMQEVEMVLSGMINKELTMCLNNAGTGAIGISGKDGSFIQAKKKILKKNGKEIDLGYVGEVEKVNEQFLLDLIEKGYLPVIAPIGFDKGGNSYNINADYAASAVSGTISAEKLILLTDVDGLYSDFENKDSLLSKLTLSECEELIERQIIQGGMLPKLQCAVEAIKKGARSVHMINGSLEHGLLLEVFTAEGIGTMIKGLKTND